MFLRCGFPQGMILGMLYSLDCAQCRSNLFVNGTPHTPYTLIPPHTSDTPHNVIPLIPPITFIPSYFHAPCTPHNLIPLIPLIARYP